MLFGLINIVSRIQRFIVTRYIMKCLLTIEFFNYAHSLVMRDLMMFTIKVNGNFSFLYPAFLSCKKSSYL